jgi:NitT/TauT family transport system substrate-binding protein
MKKALRSLCLGFFAIAGFVLAQQARADTPAIHGDGGKLRLMYNPPGTNSFPPWVIQHFGLDKKYGFELVPIPTATTASMATGFQSRGTDLGMFGWNDIARIKDGGINVVGIAPFLAFGADFIVLPKNSPIQNLGDLKGKKVGISGRTAINTIAMEALTRQKYHYDLLTDCTLQEGAPPLLWALLEQGQLDATGEFNSVEPAMVATGKFKPLTNIKGIIDQLGLPDTPYLLYTADMTYAAAHPGNVKAFLAAYREAVQILETNDQPWLDHGHELQMSDEVIAIFRTEARADLRTKFAPTTKDDINKVFAMLLATAGSDAMGMSTLRQDFMTVEYQ